MSMCNYMLTFTHKHSQQEHMIACDMTQAWLKTVLTLYMLRPIHGIAHFVK